MGLFTIAVVSSARGIARANRGPSAAAIGRKRELAAATPLFYANPSRAQVAAYLQTKIHNSSGTRAAAYTQQLDDLRRGYPYTLTANPETGSIRIRVSEPPPYTPRPTPPSAAEDFIQKRAARAALTPEQRKQLRDKEMRDILDGPERRRKQLEEYEEQREQRAREMARLDRMVYGNRKRPKPKK